MRNLFLRTLLLLLLVIGGVRVGFGEVLEADGGQVIVIYTGKMHCSSSTFLVPDKYIKSPELLSIPMEVTLYEGKDIIFNLMTYKTKVTLDDLDLPNGEYILEVIIGEQVLSQKLNW